MRVAIAEDNGFFRQALANLLGTVGVEVLTAVDSGSEVLSVVGSLHPDLVVLDLRMPPTFTDEGVTTALRIKEIDPQIGVLVLSAVASGEHAAELFRGSTRGMGYLLKDHVTDVAMLRETLERLGRGETVIDPQVVSELVSARRSAPELDLLSARERKVLELMAEGRTNAGIGRMLHLSDRTVEDHVRSLFQKLGLAELDATAEGGNKRVLAVLVWLRNHPSAGEPRTGP